MKKPSSLRAAWRDPRRRRRAGRRRRDRRRARRCRRPSAAPRWMMKTKRRSVAAWRTPCCGKPSAASAPRRRRRARKDRRVEHVHLLRNSGLTSSSASPSAGLSARAIAVRGGVAERARQQLLGERARVDAGRPCAREPLRDLDPAHQRVGRRPARGDVVVAGGRARPPHRLAELGEQRRRPSAARDRCVPSARSADTDQSHGVLNLSGCGAHASGESISAR